MLKADCILEGDLMLVGRSVAKRNGPVWIDPKSSVSVFDLEPGLKAGSTWPKKSNSKTLFVGCSVAKTNGPLWTDLSLSVSVFEVEPGLKDESTLPKKSNSKPVLAGLSVAKTNGPFCNDPTLMVSVVEAEPGLNDDSTWPKKSKLKAVCVLESDPTFVGGLVLKVKALSKQSPDLSGTSIFGSGLWLSNDSVFWRASLATADDMLTGVSASTNDLLANASGPLVGSFAKANSSVEGGWK